MAFTDIENDAVALTDFADYVTAAALQTIVGSLMRQTEGEMNFEVKEDLSLGATHTTISLELGNTTELGIVNNVIHQAFNVIYQDSTFTIHWDQINASFNAGDGSHTINLTSDNVNAGVSSHVIGGGVGEFSLVDDAAQASFRININNAIVTTGWTDVAFFLGYDAETAPFTAGATLTGTTSGATATIDTVADHGTTGVLQLSNISGTFQDNEAITDDNGTPGAAVVDGTLQESTTNWNEVDPTHSQHGAVGDGSTDDKDALVSADTAAGASGVMRAKSGKTFRSATGLTGAALWRFDHGGKLSVDSGQTVTIDQILANPTSEVFTGDGDVEFTVQPITIYPHWWGFSTSASAAVNNAAFAKAVSVMQVGDKLGIAPGVGYTISHLVFNPPDGCTLDAPGAHFNIVEPGAANVALNIGSDASTTADSPVITDRYEIIIGSLSVVDSGGDFVADWTEDNIGIRVVDSQRFRMKIGRVRGFQKGLQLRAIDNSVNVGYIEMMRCKHNEVHTHAINGLDAGDTGSINDIVFNGGDWSVGVWPLGVTTHATVQGHVWDNWASRVDVTVDAVDTTNNILTFTSAANHELRDGDPIGAFASTGALPGGIAGSTLYYAIRIDSTRLLLATTRALALAGTALNITSTGSGTITATPGSGAIIADSGPTGCVMRDGTHHSGLGAPTEIASGVVSAVVNNLNGTWTITAPWSPDGSELGHMLRMTSVSTDASATQLKFRRSGLGRITAASGSDITVKNWIGPSPTTNETFTLKNGAVFGFFNATGMKIHPMRFENTCGPIAIGEQATQRVELIHRYQMSPTDICNLGVGTRIVAQGNEYHDTFNQPMVLASHDDTSNATVLKVIDDSDAINWSLFEEGDVVSLGGFTYAAGTVAAADASLIVRDTETDINAANASLKLGVTLAGTLGDHWEVGGNSTDDLRIFYNGDLRTHWTRVNPSMNIRELNESSGPGPRFRMLRESTSPAADDELGRIEWQGRNDNAPQDTVVYAAIGTEIVSAANGVETGRWRVDTRGAADSDAEQRMYVDHDGGVVVGTPAGTSQGAGTLNAEAVHGDILVGGHQNANETVSGDGAITAGSKTVWINKATPAVMTLVDPTATTHDDYVLTFISRTAAAHTLDNSAGSGFNNGGTGTDFATFGGAVGDGITLRAFGGIWYVEASTNVTLS